ncbi:gluconate kinase [Nocardiopsis gilva YIM 90087]|uniref:Gluconokinase n=1 Tax=Nocardiopsis gilva YIM 90087 TaxID=1235441 RepID=A0A223S4Z0_9ACTN|nr:gluconokinase [Nocardiopsis gilva]ASU83185.1 gluconate kinase [Nocardiopsis gilva YIM 90087]
MHFVVMGVSGSGKSTVALRAAERLGLPLAEADRFHPAANIAKMSAGAPLTDEDRRPWLASLAEWIAEHERRGEPTLVACSALKRAYRDILRTGAPDIRFLHLHGPRSLLAQRLAERSDHFMPPALLDSQLEALEPLERDEQGVTLDIAATPDVLVERVVGIVAAGLGRVPGARG